MSWVMPARERVSSACPSRNVKPPRVGPSPGACRVGMPSMFVWKIILAPVLALVIAALALTGTRLTLATVLAILPTLAQVLAAVAFGISVAIYGF